MGCGTSTLQLPGTGMHVVDPQGMPGEDMVVGLERSTAGTAGPPSSCSCPAGAVSISATKKIPPLNSAFPLFRNSAVSKFPPIQWRKFCFDMLDTPSSLLPFMNSPSRWRQAISANKQRLRSWAFAQLKAAPDDVLDQTKIKKLAKIMGARPFAPFYIRDSELSVQGLEHDGL
jgi:hypothetical protein